MKIVMKVTVEVPDIDVAKAAISMMHSIEKAPLIDHQGNPVEILSISVVVKEVEA